MKSLSLFFGLVLVALLARALSAAPVQDFVVIAHNDVPVDTISPAALKDIYTGRTAYWDTGQSVIIVVLNGDPNSALKEVSGMDASQFKTFADNSPRKPTMPPPSWRSSPLPRAPLLSSQLTPS
jgi:hypothetical protein